MALTERQYEGLFLLGIAGTLLFGSYFNQDRIREWQKSREQTPYYVIYKNDELHAHNLDNHRRRSLKGYR